MVTGVARRAIRDFPRIRESGGPVRALYRDSRQNLPDLEGLPRCLLYDPAPPTAGQLVTLYSLGTVGSLPDDQLVEIYLARDDPAASEAAFSALVERHGAMVLSICQRVLQNPHDAHDAFQATFLVLVRKAASIRRRESVGGWLFGIARRVAVRARLEAARRRHHLEKMGIERNTSHADAITINNEPEPDYRPLIAAIDRLPERFRRPVVLHYFEGLSAEAAAERLGCPRGTVLSRLARARERLRQRLEHRGLSLEALMPATLASGPIVFDSRTVPSSLVQSTVRAASCLALAGTAIESVVPATVAIPVERGRPQSDVRQGSAGVGSCHPGYRERRDRALDGGGRRRETAAD